MTCLNIRSSPDGIKISSTFRTAYEIVIVLTRGLNEAGIAVLGMGLVV